MLAAAAQLTTISALSSADPIAATRSSLLPVAPAPLAAAAAFTPAPVDQLAAAAGIAALIVGIAGQFSPHRAVFVPALVVAVGGRQALARAGFRRGRRCEQMTRYLLDLRGCRFEYGVLPGHPPRLEPDGTVLAGRGRWDVETAGLPGEEIELLVSGGGQYYGRFMMRAKPGSRPSLQARLVVVTLADQVGRTLAAGTPTSSSW